MVTLTSFASFWTVVVDHPVFISVALATIVAQLVKTIYWTIRKKEFKLGYFFKGYGGFPSGHTAYVTALSASIYVLEGFSNLFYVTLAVSLLWIVYVLDIKMFLDINTDFFNSLIDLIEKPDMKRVETIMGHTYGQIIGGLVVGVWAVWFIFF